MGKRKIKLYSIILVLTLIALPKTIFSNNDKYFSWKNYYIIFNFGEGAKIFEGDSLKEVQFGTLPKWIANPVLTEEGIIYGNAFNGVNYQGLLYIDLNNRTSRIIDLVSLGSPSNFVDEIYVIKNIIYLKILGELYSLDLEKNKLIQKDFKCHPYMQYVFGDNIYQYRNGDILVYDKVLTQKAKIKLEKLINCKLRFVDKNYIFLDTDMESLIFSLKKKRFVFRSNTLPGFNSVIKLSDFYLISDDKSSQYFFDGEIFSKLPIHSAIPLVFNSNNRKLLLREGAGLVLKSVNSTEMIKKFNISFTGNFLEISPLISSSKNKYVSYKEKDKNIQTFYQGSIVRIDGKQTLDNFKVYVMTEPYRFYKGIIGAGQSFQFWDVGTILLSAVSFVILIYLFFLFRKEYFLSFMILLLPLLMLMISLLLNYIGIILIGYNLSLFVLILGLTVVTFSYCLLSNSLSKDRIVEGFRSFSHGSDGLNNIIRLHRLSELSNPLDETENELLKSAIDIYFSSTYKELKKIFSYIKCNNKTYWQLVRIDFLRLLIFIKFYLFTHKMFKLPRAKSNLLLLLNSIEEVKKETFRTNRTYLDKVVNTVMKIKGEELAEQNIAVVKEYPNQLKLFLEYQELYKIIDNLFSNSIDALQDVKEGKIIIKVTSNNHFSEILFMDNGMGIPTDKKNKIFDLGVTSKENGRGLGLFEVKKIIEKYFGKINYVNIEKGSLFKIYLRNYL